MTLARNHLLTGATAVLVFAIACGPPASPEIVAIQYLRATHTGESDDAIDLLDLDEVQARVEEEIVIVQREGGSRDFMRDWMISLLWDLYQTMPRREYAYDAVPDGLDDDRATAVVKMVDVDGNSSERTIHLKRTERGWLVSGPTLDPLVSFVIHRLEERY